MRQYDVTDFRDFSSRQDLKSTYEEFLKSIHKTKEEFPFEVENEVLWKGRPNHFRIVGFGGYMAETGWRVYFTYRSARNNHVIQHSWRWDSETDDAVDYRRNEFIG